jgi:hypothetical protein
MTLLDRVRIKRAWFAGQWSLDQKRHPDYESTLDILTDVIVELEDHEKCVSGIAENDNVL